MNDDRRTTQQQSLQQLLLVLFLLLLQLVQTQLYHHPNNKRQRTSAKMVAQWWSIGIVNWLVLAGGLFALVVVGVGCNDEIISSPKDVVDVCTARSIARTKQIHNPCCKMYLNCYCMKVLCHKNFPTKKKCNDLVMQCNFMISDGSNCKIDKNSFSTKCPGVNPNLTVFESNSKELRAAMTMHEDKISYILYAVAGALAIIAIVVGVYCFCRHKSKSDKIAVKSSEKITTIGSKSRHRSSVLDNRASSGNLSSKRSSQRTMSRSKQRSNTSYKGQRTGTGTGTGHGATTTNYKSLNTHTGTQTKKTQTIATGYNDNTHRTTTIGTGAAAAAAATTTTTATTSTRRNKSKSQNLTNAASCTAIKSFNSRACMTQHGFSNQQAEARNGSNNKINYTALRKALA